MSEMSETNNKHCIATTVCSIDNFIRDNHSICREERQYAVFLYNILRKYRTPESREKEGDETTDKVKKIFDACQIPTDATIEFVFYEATFMRDFFERNRRFILCDDKDKRHKKTLQKTFKPSLYEVDEDKRSESFNNKLIKYVHRHIDKDKNTPIEYRGEERNLGHNKIKECGLSSEGKFIVKCMMNAIPDIAVIYFKNNQKSFLFLECKFESREDFYKSKNQEIPSKSQRKIQGMIADFLKESGYFGSGVNVAECMEKDKKSWLVQFVREGETRLMIEKEKGKILIEELIELDKKIFY